MKKIILFIICAVIIFSVFGCKTQPVDDEIAATVIDNEPEVESNEPEEEQSNMTVDKDELQDEGINTTDDISSTDIQPNSTPITESVENQSDTVVHHGEIVRGPTHIDVGTEPAVKDINDIQGSFTDIFVGKIIDSVDVNVDYLPDVGIDSNASFKLHTVVVEKTIWTLSVTEKTTVKILHSDDTESQLWCRPYVVGNSYIISGVVQPYNGETVIIDVNSLSSQVGEDGKLVPMSAGAELVFENIATLDDFVNNSDMQRIIKTNHPIPPVYLKAYGVEEDQYDIQDGVIVILPDNNEADENKTKRSQLISDIKKSIIVGSDFKMNLEKADEIK